MTNLTLTKTQFRGGVWEGVLTGLLGPGEVPELSVTHLEQPVGEVSLRADTAHPGDWAVRIALPPEVMSDGVQTVLITDASTGDRLGAITVIAGEPLEDDIRAELDLVRAELDMLKRAFRRHCVETAG
jgi:hypothetical protein